MDVRKKCFYCEGGEILGQVDQRSCGFPIPGGVQYQVCWRFEQPGLVKGAPEGGLELDNVKGSFQPKPFDDSIKQNTHGIIKLFRLEKASDH